MCTPEPPDRPPAAEAGARAVAGLLCASIAGALGAALVYARGGQPQLEGLLLGASLGTLGAALVLWAHRLLPDREVREPWPFVDEDDAAAVPALDASFDRDEVLERRPVLRRLLLGALGALGLAAVFPVRSLGPNPGRSLRETSWRDGARLVDADGRPVHADGVPVGSMVTVFPEGHIDAADSVAVLVHVDPSVASAPAGRAGWSPGGLYAYSKLCTHAGCPVGLYVDRTHTLLCPCHQSEFDVLDAARPRSGPAARRLPQLPLRVDPDGVVVATGDFSEPVGPAWWTR